MQFHHIKIRSTRWRVMEAVLASVVFTIIGVGVIMTQAADEWEERATDRMGSARELIDNALDNAHQATIAVLGTLGKPCHDVLPSLTERVKISPDVRSVNLVHGDLLYCTTIDGAHRKRIFLDKYIDGRLALVKGIESVQDKPVLLYRLPVEKSSIVVGLDAYYLLKILGMLSDQSPMSLVVGQQLWEHNKAASDRATLSEESDYIELASTKYPFRILTKEVTGRMLINTVPYTKLSIFGVVLTGMLLGVLVFRLSGRVGSPLYEMQRALSAQEFIPYLQPTVSGANGELSGCEVLMRWQHPELGLIPPDHFIPTAESSGLIIPMTRSLMTQVREKLTPLQRQLPKGFHVAFNICASHCQDLSLIDDCRQFLAAFKKHSITLVLELTERELLVADEITKRLLTELRELGVLIAIDDFGTGQSSLIYLQQFEIDILKIDQHFVGLIGSNGLSHHIVDNVIDLATRLDLRVIAEGVETELQASYLREHQVDYQQGYLHGRPMPLVEFAQLLRRAAHQRTVTKRLASQLRAVCHRAVTHVGFKGI